MDLEDVFIRLELDWSLRCLLRWVETFRVRVRKVSSSHLWAVEGWPLLDAVFWEKTWVVPFQATRSCICCSTAYCQICVLFVSECGRLLQFDCERPRNDDVRPALDWSLRCLLRKAETFRVRMRKVSSFQLWAVEEWQIFSRVHIVDIVDIGKLDSLRPTWC